MSVGLAMVMIFTVVGCGPQEKAVTVGGKNFTEQYIISEMMAQLLEYHGFKVTLISDLSSEGLRGGMESGEIGICADYTGTAWMSYLQHTYEPGINNNQLYQMVKEEEAGNGLIWLDPMWNDNTYALASWPEFATENNITTMSDLAALYREKEGKIPTFVGIEFSARPDGLPALEQHYNFTIDKKYLNAALVGTSLAALEQHQADIAMVFGTDAPIAKYGWYVYTDDQVFFPPYDLTPYVNQDVLTKYPEIESILNELVATFPGGGEEATPEIVAECQGVWQGLNAKVDIDLVEPEDVAHEYLLAKGLIS
jgi:osmoprotectant transport system substrate-binding protein